MRVSMNGLIWDHVALHFAHRRDATLHDGTVSNLLDSLLCTIVDEMQQASNDEDRCSQSKSPWPKTDGQHFAIQLLLIVNILTGVFCFAMNVPWQG